MNMLSKKLSASTSQLAKQAIGVASTTFHAANNAISAGLQTCDEKGISKTLQDAEIRVNSLGVVTHYFGGMPTTPNPQSGSDSASSGIVGFSASPSNLINGNTSIWGTFNFRFALEVDSNTRGVNASGGFMSDNQSIRAVAKHLNDDGEIAVHCKWKRRVADKLIDIAEIIGDCYCVSADDLGSKIVVEATAADSSANFTGTAFASIGPFEISAATRKSLDGALALESTRFPVRLVSSDPNQSSSEFDQESDVVLIASSQEVKLSKPGPRNVGYTREWSCRYGSEFPRVKLDVNSNVNFELVLSATAADSLQLRALSRNQRDLIALTTRCFHAKQFVATAVVLEHVTRLTHLNKNGPWLGHNSLDAESLSSLECTDLFVCIQRLVAEVNMSTERQEKFSRGRNRAVAEKEALEQDIAATIEAYQNMLLKLQKNSGFDDGLLLNTTSVASLTQDMTQRASYVGGIETQLQESTQQCKKYMTDLELLRCDYRNLLAKQKSLEDNEAEKMLQTGDAFQRVKMLEQQVESLTKLNIGLSKKRQEEESYAAELTLELDRLKSSSNAALTKSSLFSTFEDVGTKNREITRLKNEVYEAVLDKQSIQAELGSLSQDKKELQDNFLYIKQKYDTLRQTKMNANDLSERRFIDLQRELRHSKERTSELEHELSQAQTTLDGVLTEKKRLQKKTESLAKDLDKTRNDMTTSVQRLTHTNQQLLEEKSAVEQTLKTLEVTTEEQNEHLSQTNASISTIIRQNTSDTVELLQTQLRERDDVIEQLQEDNETLKSRVRKLAMMG